MKNLRVTTALISAAFLCAAVSPSDAAYVPRSGGSSVEVNMDALSSPSRSDYNTVEAVPLSAPDGYQNPNAIDAPMPLTGSTTVISSETVGNGPSAPVMSATNNLAPVRLRDPSKQVTASTIPMDAPSDTRVVMTRETVRTVDAATNAVPILRASDGQGLDIREVPSFDSTPVAQPRTVPDLPIAAAPSPAVRAAPSFLSVIEQSVDRLAGPSQAPTPAYQQRIPEASLSPMPHAAAPATVPTPMLSPVGRKVIEPQRREVIVKQQPEIVARQVPRPEYAIRQDGLQTAPVPTRKTALSEFVTVTPAPPISQMADVPSDDFDTVVTTEKTVVTTTEPVPVPAPAPIQTDGVDVAVLPEPRQPMLVQAAPLETPATPLPAKPVKQENAQTAVAVLPDDTVEPLSAPATMDLNIGDTDVATNEAPTFSSTLEMNTAPADVDDANPDRPLNISGEIKTLKTRDTDLASGTTSITDADVRNVEISQKTPVGEPAPIQAKHSTRIVTLDRDYFEPQPETPIDLPPLSRNEEEIIGIETLNLDEENSAPLIAEEQSQDAPPTLAPTQGDYQVGAVSAPIGREAVTLSETKSMQRPNINLEAQANTGNAPAPVNGRMSIQDEADIAAAPLSAEQNMLNADMAASTQQQISVIDIEELAPRNIPPTPNSDSLAARSKSLEDLTVVSTQQDIDRDIQPVAAPAAVEQTSNTGFVTFDVTPDVAPPVMEPPVSQQSVENFDLAPPVDEVNTNLSLNTPVLASAPANDVMSEDMAKEENVVIIPLEPDARPAPVNMATQRGYQSMSDPVEIVAAMGNDAAPYANFNTRDIDNDVPTQPAQDLGETPIELNITAPAGRAPAPDFGQNSNTSAAAQLASSFDRAASTADTSDRYIIADASDIDMPAEPVETVQAFEIQNSALDTQRQAFEAEENGPVSSRTSVLSSNSTSSRSINMSSADETLSTDAQNNLDQLAQSLVDNPASRVQLMSYASSADQSESSARRISLARAIEARTYLMSKGLDANRIDVRALGQDSAAGSDMPADRIDIVIQP